MEESKGTQWYLDMTKRLDSVTSDLKNGNSVKHKLKLAKLQKAYGITDFAFSFAHAFGRTEQSTEAHKASLSLLDIARTATIKRFNDIHAINL